MEMVCATNAVRSLNPKGIRSLHVKTTAEYIALLGF